jgi:hypothetical protein
VFIYLQKFMFMRARFYDNRPTRIYFHEAVVQVLLLTPLFFNHRTFACFIPHSSKVTWNTRGCSRHDFCMSQVARAFPSAASVEHVDLFRVIAPPQVLCCAGCLSIAFLVCVFKISFHCCLTDRNLKPKVILRII